ncbi:hypothetical protein TU94_00960 [Streptomyces cyaneogriseus subsp. noncyanogenus]|uniref:Acyl-CoA carboxylase subunit epsilon n=1 Tax=Streptomyces cyaneogriseus subsp. noncyanogenus TaxID=477245 RepID=A0A0C5G8H0_9ACTN|nr:hypothetical protein [Streptomyces cyaneogriseus]AJP00326.1 hypothetical protein TU94_00960 [Streptomyces cyaneogriseus subsp. noncyanogenus]
MDGVGGRAAWLRIERGRATDEEVAAVAVTLLSLLARCAGGAEGAVDGAAGAGGGQDGAVLWERGERAGGYRAPGSWR